MRLIDADALLQKIDTERDILVKDGRLGTEHILVHYVREFIEDAPTVDAVEVVKDMLKGEMKLKPMKQAMKIGDEVYIHGYIDEIRPGTIKDEIKTKEELTHENEENRQA